jgi:aminoglycoside phosphotransferase family enzyme/predicted kinase
LQQSSEETAAMTGDGNRNAEVAQGEVVAFLADPKNYRSGLKSVTRIDTHAAMVFLAGKRAYKIKRAVRFAYMDFSSLEKRRRACERELELNRRTAPLLYEGLMALVRRADGGLAFEGPLEPGEAPKAQVIEWAVAMKRFDEGALFTELARDGRLSGQLIDTLCDEVKRFHDGARHVTPEPGGGTEGFDRVIAGNLAELKASPGCFPPDAVAGYEERLAAATERLWPLVQARAAAGWQRHCHGDLHLANICLWHGKPLLFDCLEFNDDLAEIDVLYDLAFLIMDLLQRGLPAFANQVMNRAASGREEIAGLALLPLFLYLRAAVRANVRAAAAKAQQEPAMQKRLTAEAKSYFAAAESALSPLPPRLIAVGGLSGSGKTSLARALAPDIGAGPGALHLRSDLLRKERFGVDPLTRLPPEAYRPEVSEAVYRELLQRAEIALDAGRTVIADAVFTLPAGRARLEALAAARGIAFTGLWLEAPANLLGDRVEARRGDASDATPAVVRHQLAEDCGKITWQHLDAQPGLEAVLAKARESLG